MRRLPRRCQMSAVPHTQLDQLDDKCQKLGMIIGQHNARSVQSRFPPRDDFLIPGLHLGSIAGSRDDFSSTYGRATPAAHWQK
jgi:hypothetical protein